MHFEVDARKPVDHRNWSDNIEFTAREIAEPSSVDELMEAVKSAPRRVKVFGTAHSFNDIADTDDVHVSLKNFTNIKVNKAGRSVTFGAGVTYTQLIEALVKEGLALPNLPSLPHLNVVGSVVTGTHGSGVSN